MDFLQDITSRWIIIFIITGFIAGYIDSIAGGGGMVQVPILFGVTMATITYYLSKKISLKVVSIAIIPCLIASYIGSELVMFLSNEII